MSKAPVRSEAELQRLVRVNRWVLRLTRCYWRLCYLFLTGLSLVPLC